MSTTLHLECDTCKESIWIGQRDYIYTGSVDTMKLLGKFLTTHESGWSKIHDLHFRSSVTSRRMSGEDGWVEIET